MNGIPEATRIVLSAEERTELEGLVRSTKTEYRLRQRARIVLLAAGGMASRAIGRTVGCTTGTTSKWRVRYADRRLAGLDETGERGAEPKYTAETGKRILALLDQPPPKGCPLDGAIAGCGSRRSRCPVCLAVPARAEDRPRRAQILVREQRSRVRCQGCRRGRALHGAARERDRHLRRRKDLASFSPSKIRATAGVARCLRLNTASKPSSTSCVRTR